MEDYIVLILTVFILIVGAVGKSKRKIIPQPQNEEPVVPDNIWEMMKELGVQQPAPQPVENVIEKVEIMEAPKENQFYGFTAKEEGGSILKYNIFKRELNLKKTNISEIKKGEQFSLRKAIIYSEILNRKYI